ncbi:MAG: hypothetical protein BWX88_03958 [Planctomycetes bacterium ADurb.Bin126]|nr:MAG: hypothetical protein BWX88_03958 [Planctomycetes bacterium ADurb.Bin126]HOD80333.1 hypothetical protein [Phycisphaerae bacterium]HQL75086.1 hypothetical protein [Phycisphaerae bacterium]
MPLLPRTCPPRGCKALFVYSPGNILRLLVDAVLVVFTPFHLVLRFRCRTCGHAFRSL